MHANFFHLFRGALAAALLATPTLLSAQNVTVATDPYGALVIPLKGNSDTKISFPVHRAPALEAQVASVTGNVITLAAPISLTASQYVYAAGTQPNHFYVKFLSGPREGMFYDVTANGTNTLTVDLSGDTLEGVVATGNILQVIPHWTLNTVFPSGQGVHGTPSSLAPRQSQVLIPTTNLPGINYSSSDSYYYLSAAPTPGWRRQGFSGDAGDTVLFPDLSYVVRHSVAGDTEVVLTGAVSMSKYATVLATLAPNTPQDITVGVGVPADVSLADSKLVESGAFAPSASTLNIKDRLLVFDPAAVQQNKAATDVYFYVTGSGWRRPGDPAIYDNALVFKPGWGFVIRKAATTTPQSAMWSFVPVYLTPDE